MFMAFDSMGKVSGVPSGKANVDGREVARKHAQACEQVRSKSQSAHSKQQVQHAEVDRGQSQEEGQFEATVRGRLVDCLNFGVPAEQAFNAVTENLAANPEDHHGGDDSRNDHPEQSPPKAPDCARCDGEQRFGKEQACGHDEDGDEDHRRPWAQVAHGGVEFSLVWLDPLGPDEEDYAHEGDGKGNFDRDAPPRSVVLGDRLDVEFKTG